MSWAAKRKVMRFKLKDKKLRKQWVLFPYLGCREKRHWRMKSIIGRELKFITRFTGLLLFQSGREVRVDAVIWRRGDGHNKKRKKCREKVVEFHKRSFFLRQTHFWCDRNHFSRDNRDLKTAFQVFVSSLSSFFLAKDWLRLIGQHEGQTPFTVRPFSATVYVVMKLFSRRLCMRRSREHKKLLNEIN